MRPRLMQHVDLIEMDNGQCAATNFRHSVLGVLYSDTIISKVISRWILKCKMYIHGDLLAQQYLISHSVTLS